LRIQADGLSGNLDKFWPDIKDSKWIGGNAEGWERLPYWLDGFIPLAWLLNDEDMKSRARYYVNYIIDHQREDGWICPDDETAKKDLWAFFLMLRVLVLYHDATEKVEALDARGQFPCFHPCFHETKEPSPCFQSKGPSMCFHVSLFKRISYCAH
jgi:hypothetical protein